MNDKERISYLETVLRDEAGTLRCQDERYLLDTAERMQAAADGKEVPQSSVGTFTFRGEKWAVQRIRRGERVPGAATHGWYMDEEAQHIARGRASLSEVADAIVRLTNGSSRTPGWEMDETVNDQNYDILAFWRLT